MPGEVLASGGVDLNTIKTVATIAGVAGAVGIGNKFLKPYVRVPVNHEAIRVRGGVPSRYKWGSRKGMVKCMPLGPHASIPFSHDIEIVDLRVRSTDLPNVMIDRPGSSQYNVEASVLWHVLSSNVQRRHWLRPWRKQFTSGQDNDFPARFKFEGQDSETILQKIACDGLRNAIKGAPDEHFDDSQYLGNVVATSCNPELQRYGIAILGIKLGEASEGAPDRLGKYISGDTPNTPLPSELLAAADQLGIGGLRLATVDGKPVPPSTSGDAPA